ncbi:3-isopropylmalate dehydratase [candidate division WOR-3 bacterium]|nr:3-isopropylmalate dehydratase [candidate division WOR-3 bacterium]
MKIWRYGDNINTDMLFPGKYTYTCSTPEEIKPHILEDLDPAFAKGVNEGDIILAGKNFGCGSSREQPVVGLKEVGIQAVLAESFARIFYRSAINQGLILIECPEAVRAYSDGDMVELNMKEGEIKITGKSFSFPKLPTEILAIRKAGGLIAYTREKLKGKNYTNY